MILVYILIGVFVLWAALSYTRFLVKRLICQSKLKKVCKQNGYQLHKNHPLWFLGNKSGKNCDCCIETSDFVFCIKFFGVIPRLKTLVFVEESTYFLRSHMDVLLRVKESFDGEKRELPAYDFFENAFPGKEKKPVLLVNPVPVEMVRQFSNGKEVILHPGEKIRDMEVYNQSGLLTKLDAKIDTM